MVKKGKQLLQFQVIKKSKAIGKAGLNIRLASMLTKYEIELVEVVSINSTSSLNNENNNQVVLKKNN